MKFLILNTDYPEFLRWLYNQDRELEQKSYDEQIHVRMESLFGVADFYSTNLRKLGHDARDIYANNEFMQKAWAKEHGINSPTCIQEPLRETLEHGCHIASKTPLRYLKPVLRPLRRISGGRPAWFYDILAAQLKHYRADVLLNQDMEISGRFLKEMKPYVRMLVGQIASPIPRGNDFNCYDLVISSLPSFVEYFRRIGLSSERHNFGFEPDVLKRLPQEEKSIPVSFVGSLSRAHASRIRWLEYLCRNTGIEVWGHGVETLPRDSWIRKRYKGTAWGVNMYRLLSNSKITVNHHIGVAGSYANNMRLFEAAGVGCLLVTDWKINLDEVLRVDNEVVAYRSPEECAARIHRYLENDSERRAVAMAGQVRILQHHTYARRMEELVEIVRAYL